MTYAATLGEPPIMSKKNGSKAHRPRDGEDSITGSVIKLFFNKPGFSAGRLETVAGDRVAFAGPVFFSEDDFVTLFGAWHQDPKWGRQFKAQRFEYAAGGAASLDVTGLAHYLSVSKDFVGIGPVKARKIAERFGDKFEETLESDPESIAAHVNLPLESVIGIRTAWRRNSSRNATATWLAGFGLTAYQMNSIIDAFGNNTVKILTEDPYRMIEVIDGFGFLRVDEIARKMGIAKTHPSRIQAGIHHVVSEQLGEGHTWTGRDELTRKSNTLLTIDELNALELIQEELTGMVGEARLHVDTDERVSLPAVRKMEFEIEGWLRDAAGSTNPNWRGTASLSLIPTDSRLNEDQQAAVKQALAGQLTVITGGAGSGKTFVIGVIVSEFLARGCKAIALCAPTGKAARRISESLTHMGVPFTSAATIHRTLGYRGEGSWGYSLTDPLPVDLLVVDEFSMVDVLLAHRLIQAIDWKRTAVVFVGDHNQLPPIGPGNVLRDLLNTGLVPTCYLTKCVRQAGELKQNSLAILDGRVPAPPRQRGDVSAPWYVIDSAQMSEAEYCRDVVVSMIESRIEHLRPHATTPGTYPKEAWDLLRDVQVLTPTHKGPLGTKELNASLQRVLQSKLYGVTTEPVDEKHRLPFLVGDKIIQTKNDYDLGVMNGTIGYILEIDSDTGDLLVDFDWHDHPIVVKKKGGCQGNLMHAYALTIHKMQGSEVPVAVVVTHKAHSFQQHQAMLYTGVTRARHVAIIVGDAWGIRNAAQKRLVERRRTFLSSSVTLKPVEAAS